MASSQTIFNHWWVRCDRSQNRFLIRHGRRYGWSCFCQKKTEEEDFAVLGNWFGCQRSYVPILNSMKHVPSGRIGSHQAGRLRSSVTVELRVWSSPVGNDSEYSCACVRICVFVDRILKFPSYLSRYIVFNNLFHSLKWYRFWASIFLTIPLSQTTIHKSRIPAAHGMTESRRDLLTPSEWSSGSKGWVGPFEMVTSWRSISSLRFFASLVAL